MSPQRREVDPGDLRLPSVGQAASTLGSGIRRSVRQFVARRDDLPPILVHEDPDGVLEITDGVTRATRVAKLTPGEPVPVVVIGRYRRSRASSPRVRDRR